jgi:gliding motility-associated-like protein
MNKFLFFILSFSFAITQIAQSQTYTMNPYLPGTTCATCIVNSNNNPKGGDPNASTFNGNGFIANSYVATACGLNYTIGKVKLGKRLPQPGANQPAAISISGMPTCFIVLRAYLYVGGSGNGININATVTNPAATSSVFPMTQIGNHVDKCWGYTGTYNYRADITALITGNGNYAVSGIPTNPPVAGNDMDGASIVVVYRDLSQNFTGHIVIADGCQVGIGGQQTSNITGWSACAASSFASAFMIVGDLQNVGIANCFMNSGISNFNYPSASQDWWDNIVMSPAPNVTAGQNTTTFGLNSGGDCYNIVAAGLYYRTTCNVCTPPTLTITTATTSSCTVGSATAFVTGGSAPYSYTWTPSNLTTSAITNVPTGNYTVTVRDASGCITGTATAFIPAANASITVNSGTICLGNSITLSAAGGNTYTWTPNINLSSTNGNPVIANPSTSTIYTVTATNSLNCIGSATANVVVNPLPVITVNNPTACTNSPFTLTATGGTAYAWAGPNGFTSALQNPVLTNAQLNMSGNYTVTVTSAQGCTNTAVSNVLISPLPTITVSGTGTLCSQNFNGSNNTTALSANGASTYTWALPAGFSGAPNLNSNPLTVNGPITAIQTIATMSVTGSNGSCTNSAVHTLTVLPNPTIAVSSGSMCAGTSVALTSGGASTYTWSPNTALNTNLGPNVIASPAATTIYSVVGTTNGCNSQTGTGTASVVPNPTVVITPANPAICLGDNISLTATGATNYSWTPNTALSSTNTAVTIANPSVTTTYSIIGSQATCTHVTAVTVSVLPLPSVTVSLSSPTICMNNFNGSPNSVTLTASGASQYNWGPITGLNVSGFSGPVITGSSDGNALITGTVVGVNGTCSNVATFSMTAIPNPTIAVSSASMCSGFSASLSASGANNYSWSPNTALSSTNSAVVIANPNVTTVYNVIGSTAGCNSQTQSGTASVVANPTVSIAPFTPTICFGSSIGLTANGAQNYSWSPNSAITNTTGQNVTVSPSVNTTYYLIGEQSTCIDSTAITVTVVPLPVINISVSSPSMCMNNFNNSPNSVNITASGASSYNWIGFSGVIANNSNIPNITVTPVNQLTNASGTVVGSISTCTNSASFTLNIVPNPVISVSTASMCFGTDATLTAIGADNYNWTPATNLNITTGSVVIASPSASQTYSVVGSSMNCNSATQTGVVNVIPNPVITISPLNPTICAGDAVALNANGASTYTWIPSNTVDNPFSPVVMANPVVTTNYTVIGSANSCTSSAIRQVSVIALPNLQAIANPAAICNGDKTTINANGANAYTWSPTYGLSDPYSNFVVANPTVTTLYTLTGNNGICTASISVPIVVLNKPVITLTTSDPKICFGNSSTIFAAGAQSFSWAPNTNMNIISNNAAVVTPSASTNYTIIGMNTSGSISCVMTQEIMVEVVPPIVTSTSGSVAICKGESTKLYAGGSNSYVWAPQTGLSNSLIASPVATPSITTVYTVYVSNGGFCGTTGTVLVKVNPQPTVNAGPDLIFNSDEPMYLNASGNGTLTWVFGDGILCTPCPNTQILPSNSGYYRIQAINEFGCKATDELYVEVTNYFNIYIPNIFTPNEDGLNDVFLVYGTGITDLEMTIFDRWGEKLYVSTDQLKGWDGTYKNEMRKNDVCVYKVTFKSLDGKVHTRTGHVTLMK